MSNTYIGNAAGGSESPVNSNWDPVKGWSTTRKFRGTEAYVREMESDMILQGYTTQLTAGAVWELSASVAADTRDGNPPGMGPNDVVDTWELFAGKIEKDLLSCDSAEIAAITLPHVSFIRDIMDGKINASLWDSSTTAKNPPDGTASAFGGNADTFQIFKAVVGGTKTKQIFQPTIRHTQTMATGASFTSYVANAGKIYSSAKLVSTYNVPSNIAATLRTSATTTRTDGLIVFSGWFMDHPSVQIAAGQKTQLTQEWTWGIWAKAVMGLSNFVT